MTYFAGLDVGLEETAICIIDSNGRIVRELKACSDPEALVRALRVLDVRYARVGLEACPLSSWLFEGLAAAGLPVVCGLTAHSPELDAAAACPISSLDLVRAPLASVCRRSRGVGPILTSYAGSRGDATMHDLIATLVSFFLIEPLQVEMAEQLAAARAPQAVIAGVSTCARTAAPIGIERAASDPWWAAANAVRLWAGWARPETVLVEAAPACAPAVEAALPFLTEQGS